MTINSSINMSEILYLILHNSLTKYRTKNSKATLLDQAEAAKHEGTDRKGGLFLVRKKNNFTPSGVRGFVATSMEALLAVIGDTTHRSEERRVGKVCR